MTRLPGAPVGRCFKDKVVATQAGRPDAAAAAQAPPAGRPASAPPRSLACARLDCSDILDTSRLLGINETGGRAGAETTVRGWRAP
jgi:hypothetical protein